MKVCCRCKVEKTLNEFSKNKSRKEGFSLQCKICVGEYQSKWYIKNLEKVKEKCLKWQKENPERTKEIQSRRYKANIEKVKEDRILYVETMPDSYIAIRLRRQGFPKELINNPEVIKIKRLIIQTKRLCKI